MALRMVIVVEVVCQYAAQMPFIEHDQVIQTFPAGGSDDAFATWILSGRRGRDEDFVDAHAFHAFLD